MPHKAARAAPRDADGDPRIKQLGGRLDFSANISCARTQDAQAVVLGVDIGAAGAVALLSRTGDLIGVNDMPVLADGPAGRATSAALLAEIVSKSHAMIAFVKHVSARPGEGPTGAFAFGRSRGVVGICAALGLPIAFLTPPVWKRLVGIAPRSAGAKDAARSEAIRRRPSQAHLFARAKDNGRAAAALIAAAGIIRDQTQPKGNQL